MLKPIWTVLSLSMVAAAASASAQSAREAAVAIDRVPIPPADTLQVERIGPRMKAPWSIAFLSDGSMLVTEKHGGIRHIKRSGASTGPLEGGPVNVLQDSDSGLLDIVLDPDFASNGFVYVAFAEGTEQANRTAIWKARFDGARLTGGRVIFRVNQPKAGVNHPGGRLLFLPDKTLLLTVGEGFDYKEKAQDPASHLGKVLCLTRSGVAAPDNPFVGRPGYAPEIWTMGHRNIQGLMRDPATSIIWSHEHGPRGGDEINVLEAGKNYGWPLTTNGIDYDGKLISERAHAPGIASPKLVWAPSIAPSGLAMYHGTLFPELEGRLLVGALAARAIVQVRIGQKTGLLSEEARLLTGLKMRVRDIRVAPDGNIFWLSDDEDDGGLYRILPPAEQLAAPRKGEARSVRELAFLLGQWTGKAELRLADRPGTAPIQESSQTLCQPALKGTYVQCATTFSRADGRSRSVISYFNYDPDSRSMRERVLATGWGGISDYPIDFDAGAREWVGRSRTTDAQGRPADERIIWRNLPDGRTIEHSEAYQSEGSSEWVQTFRWTLTKS